MGCFGLRLHQNRRQCPLLLHRRKVERHGDHGRRVYQDAHVGVVPALRHRAFRRIESLPGRGRKGASFPGRRQCASSPVFRQAALSAGSDGGNGSRSLQGGRQTERAFHSALRHGSFVLSASRHVRYDRRTGCETGEGCAADRLRIARRGLFQDRNQADHGRHRPRTGPRCSTWNR